MDKSELARRTRTFALQVIAFINGFPGGKTADVLGKQLLRSDTSIGANYVEAMRAESRNDFIHKVAIVEKEAAETLYWLQLCEGADLGDAQERARLAGECNELVAIFTRTGKTAKANGKPRVSFKSAFRNPPSEMR